VNSPRPSDAGLAEIDWHSFLQRPPLLSPPSLESFRDESVLITGAGGSIGSALSLRLASIAPRSLVLLDASEQALYRLQQRLVPVLTGNLVTILGSVNDSALLNEICTRHEPTLVFHAAAHKHAPLLEQQPLAAITTNTLATYTLTECLKQHGVPRMVLLSTDKAVDPANILGATKRVAERITLAYDGIAVRLANVLGSEGSVAEFFYQRVQHGLPLPITDARATRLFLTSAETVDLLLTAAKSANTPSLLIPSLQNAHSIKSLAEFLTATLSSPHPVEQIPCGLRPGDKLHEALVSADEFTVPTGLSALLEVHPLSPESHSLPHQLSQLAKAVQDRNLPRAMGYLFDLVPTYTPSAQIHRLLDLSRTGVPTE